jgi:GR25 family glycosyltransferase involved in LPS biosynthesis
MKCFFINLDQAKERRLALEQNFARFALPHWSLERFAAVDTQAVQARKITGHLRPTEMACGVSHLDLIRAKRSEPAPFLILEDDALFGPHSCKSLSEAVDRLEQQDTWDILFPDLCIVQIGVMADLLALRRELMREGQFRLLDPSRWAFSSATSYILHPRAIPKILSAEPKNWTLPYDLLLRQLVQQGRLRARCIFPFALSLEETSNRSTITRAMKPARVSFGICFAG